MKIQSCLINKVDMIYISADFYSHNMIPILCTQNSALMRDAKSCFCSIELNQKQQIRQLRLQSASSIRLICSGKHNIQVNTHIIMHVADENAHMHVEPVEENYSHVTSSYIA
jgi:hypothetical protein